MFGDLPCDVQLEAIRRYKLMTEKWGRDLPGWRRAILVGQAKRWAMTSDEERSRWGRAMLAKRGGLAVQNKYRIEGRIGPKHPAHKASAKSVTRRKWNKLNKASNSLQDTFKPNSVIQSTDKSPQEPKLRSRLLALW
jgi:hypothetical protein